MTPEQKVLFDNLNKEKEEGSYKNITTKIIDNTNLNEAVEKLNELEKETTMTEKQFEELARLEAKEQLMMQLFGGKGKESLDKAISAMEKDIKYKYKKKGN